VALVASGGGNEVWRRGWEEPEAVESIDVLRGRLTEGADEGISDWRRLGG